jgi:hypothetical protein
MIRKFDSSGTAVIGFEQLLMTVSNFAVTWTALKTLNVDNFATFAFLWAICWGGFAVLSEFLVSPNRVLAAQNLNYQPLLASSAAFGIGSLVSATLALIVDFKESNFLLTTSALFAVVSFYSLRAVLLETSRRRSFALSVVSFATNIGLLATAYALGFLDQPEGLLLCSSLSFILATALFAPHGQILSNFLGNLRDATTQASRQGAGFGLATLSRVLTYSVFFLAILESKEGPLGLAVFAAIMTTISPSQIFTAALAWSALPDLARAFESGKFRLQIRRQLLIYVIAGVVTCAALAIAWPLWVGFIVSDPALLKAVSPQLILTLVLMFSIVTSAFPSNVFHVLHAQRQQFIISLSSGLLGLAVLSGGLNPLLSASVSYLTYTTVSCVVAAILTRKA